MHLPTLAVCNENTSLVQHTHVPGDCLATDRSVPSKVSKRQAPITREPTNDVCSGWIA